MGITDIVEKVWVSQMGITDIVEKDGYHRYNIVEKVQEARISWFGHVLRRQDEEPCRMAWTLSVEGDRGRGRAHQSWSDDIKEDLEEKELAKGDVVDRFRWRSATKAADPRTVWD
ncbi:uncharacterized protein LOC134779071 [Penaeus indicus]|uniref:uncharacterized protein LOC134779071 n=1 Tax=Penaeus indicus TaxID=29960 RepID=UPI00300CBD1C